MLVSSPRRSLVVASQALLLAHLKKAAGTRHLLKNSAGRLVKTCDSPCAHCSGGWRSSYLVTLAGSLSGCAGNCNNLLGTFVIRALNVGDPVCRGCIAGVNCCFAYFSVECGPDPPDVNCLFLIMQQNPDVVTLGWDPEVQWTWDLGTNNVPYSCSPASLQAGLVIDNVQGTRCNWSNVTLTIE